MRGRGRKADGPERRVGAPGLFHFSSNDLPPEERLERWQDVVGRTLTGCASSPLPSGDLRVGFDYVGGRSVRLAHADLRHVRNHRDGACLRDGDEDLVFFLLLEGEATVEHLDGRHRLHAGDGVLARFDRTIDTAWPDARLLLIRLDRAALGGCDADRAAGVVRPGSDRTMRLLRSYACAAWSDGTAEGGLLPMAERHIAELIGALGGDLASGTGSGAGAARLVAMREAMRRDFGNPCLAMRHVAAAAGISERAGHLHFQAAGLCFTSELQRIRLDRARELLERGGGRVMDVAYAVGFSDLSHFHRLFKGRFGHTPGEARGRAC